VIHQERKRLAHRAEDRIDIHVHDVVPQLIVQVMHGRHVVQCSRNVRQGIQLAVFLPDHLDDAPALSGVGHIPDVGLKGSRPILDFFCKLLQRILTQVEGDDVGALPNQLPDRSVTHAGGGAHHEDDIIFEPHIQKHLPGLDRA